MDLTEHALLYARQGFSVIPVRGKRYIGRTWKKYQTTPMPEPEIRKRFSSPQVTGLAVILGNVSGDVCCRDFDKTGAYEAWAAKYPDYASTLPTGRTARGFHVYFRAKNLKTRKLPDGELRGKGSYCLLPPSKHPTGPTYKWLREPCGEIPTIDPNHTGLLPAWTDVTQGYRDVGTQELRNTGNTGTHVVGIGHRLPTLAQNQFSAAIQDAVNAALPTGRRQNHDCLFVLARGMLTIQKHRRETGQLGPDEVLPVNFLQDAFDLWYKEAEARSCLRPGLIRDAYLVEFLEAWEDVKIPFGEGSLDKIFEATKKSKPPEVARKFFKDPQIILLCTLCRELQRAAGETPFFLSCRKVQELFGLPYPMEARRWLTALQAIGILAVDKKGSFETGKATSFFYLPTLD